MTNQDIIQDIRNDARRDFDDLTSLLIVAKLSYDKQPKKWRGMEHKISSVIDSINALLNSNYYSDVLYFSLIKEVNYLCGFIDGRRSFDKSEDELGVAKNQAMYFGSLRVFDAGCSAEYFSVFFPLLKGFRDENADLFVTMERKRGASIRLVWDDDASA